MPTREVYEVNQRTQKSAYAGYARFDDDGRYLGSFGGYGENRRSNSPRRNASRLQNKIVTAGARQERRRRRAGL